MYLVGFALILIVIVAVFIPVIGFNVLFLILGALIAWAIFMRNKSLKENINKVPEQALHVTNLGWGGVFELRGVGDNYKDMTLKVLAKHLYQQGDFSWYELECDNGTDEKVWVEIEDDDETTVSVVLEKAKLSDVYNGYGGKFTLLPEQLDEIDDNESGSVTYKNLTYSYTDSDKATFYRFCDSTKAEPLYYWDFENGNKSLSIEKWGDSEYQVFLCQKMRPSQITVLRNNEG